MKQTKRLKRFFLNRGNRYCKEDDVMRRLASASKYDLQKLVELNFLIRRKYKNHVEYKLKK